MGATGAIPRDISSLSSHNFPSLRSPLQPIPISKSYLGVGVPVGLVSGSIESQGYADVVSLGFDC